MSYEFADGGEIPNLGERKFLMFTPERLFPKKIIFQLADVHKPLLSVARAADAGFDCLLGKEGGRHIPHTRGKGADSEKGQSLCHGVLSELNLRVSPGTHSPRADLRDKT